MRSVESPSPLDGDDSRRWLVPYYDAVARRRGFANLSAVHQLGALIDRIEADDPDRARALRGSASGRERALLAWLAAASSEKPAAGRLLWRLRKGDRELRCLAVDLAFGTDLRLLEEGDFRRTVLCADPRSAAVTAEGWIRRLQERGWVTAGLGEGPVEPASPLQPR